MRVLELLNHDVAVTHRNERLVDAIARMRDRHVGALVVVEDEKTSCKPVGMLTDRDVVVGVLARDVSHLPTLDVGDVMTRDLVTATADEDVAQLLRRMRNFGVRRVPVVDERGALEGIVTLDDVLSGLAGELAEAAMLGLKQRDREPVRRP